MWNVDTAFLICVADISIQSHFTMHDKLLYPVITKLG